MKTRLATTLSLVGVLLAGSAAALANTQILSGGDTASGASSAVLPESESVDLTIPAIASTTTSSTTTTNPSTTTTTTAANELAANAATTTMSTTTTTPTASEFLTTFNVGEAGSVTVDVIAGRLRLVEAVPGAGWSVAKSEEDGEDNEVEVEFRSSTVAVEFEAQLVDGQIVPEVSSRSLIQPSPAPAAAPANNTSPDEDPDDDDHDDDDHDDDDHDDDERDDDDDHDDDERDDDERDDEDDEDERDDD